MRSLTIGDRTISYDTGLNYVTSPMHSDMSQSQFSDGTDSPGDVTDPGTSTSTSSEADYSGTASVCSEEHEDYDGSLGREGSRKLIKPDLLAMSQLLNFDEEEEDDLESEEDCDEEKSASPTDWQKAVVKDLAQQSTETVKRRHSISLCQNSYRRKNSTSNSSTGASTSPSSSPSNQSSPKTSFSSQCSNYSQSDTSPPYRLNTSQMHASLQEEYNSPEWQRALQTLNLSLEEVAHIRSVLTKAELEGLPLDGCVKDNVGKGKVCFLCMKTRFGLFSRGQRCEMCKQVVCARCHTKMNIPVEHFTATPVYALSPCQENANGGQNNSNNNTKERLPIFKLGVPPVPGITNSAGSAPSSPGMTRRLSMGNQTNQLLDQSEGALSLDNSYLGISTISGITSLPPTSPSPTSFQPVSLPPNYSKYNTLPKNRTNRRWSMIGSRTSERQKLEGSPLNVCHDCKEMVLQVIRTSRTTKKMQIARSMFFNNLTPSSYQHHRL